MSLRDRICIYCGCTVTVEQDILMRCYTVQHGVNPEWRRTFTERELQREETVIVRDWFRDIHLHHERSALAEVSHAPTT